jgi:2'-5' RNA ligase
MVAVVSLLDAAYTRIVNEIINDLEHTFGLRGVKITADPHITWVICEVSKLMQLKTYLSKVAGCTYNIRVKTTGLGVFPGKHPVIFVPVIRADGLNMMHTQLFNGIQPISGDTVTFYNPDQWVPHISLALRDTTPELLPQIVSHLNQRTFNWEIELNNISILMKSGEQYTQEAIYSLLKQ